MAMNKLTLGDHTFSTTGLHPEARLLMVFIIEHLTDLSTNPRTAGFDDKHLGIMADILGQYAAMQCLLKHSN